MRRKQSSTRLWQKHYLLLREQDLIFRWRLHVKQPDNDDWLKLQRLIEYLYGTKNLFLTLEANNTNILKWYVDAAYAVHPGMKSHTGATLKMGQGHPIIRSTK